MDGFSVGGVEKYQTDLMLRISKERFVVGAISVSEPPKNTKYIDELKKNGNPVYFVPPEEDGEYSFMYLVQELKKCVEDFQPDIIHSHHCSIRYAIVADLFIKNTYKLHTVHADAFLEAYFIGKQIKTPWYGKFQRLPFYNQDAIDAGIDKLVRGKYHGVNINLESKVYPKFLVEDARNDIFKGARMIEKAYKWFGVHPLAISESVKESVQMMYGLEEVDVILNGIDHVKYSTDALEKKTSDKVTTLIHVGRFDEGKNQELLINTMIEVVKTRKDIRLVLVGDGRFRLKLMKYALKNGVLDFIDFVGESNEVRKYLAQSDIFLMCSIGEGFCLAVVEAMAASLPVISVNIGAIKEIIENNVNGFLIEPNNPVKFAESIIALADDKKLQHAMGENGKRMAKKFTIDKAVSEYEMLYQDIYTNKLQK